MIKITFLCHGNICRSPMAEVIFKDMVKKRGLEKEFYIDSAAISNDEIGNPVYPPAKRKLAEYGLKDDGHTAHKITPAEFDAFDYVIVMDDSNIDYLARIVGNEKANDTTKVHKMMEFAGVQPVPRNDAADVADPWYTRNFEVTYQDLIKGCKGLLEFLE